jgi:transposase
MYNTFPKYVLTLFMLVRLLFLCTATKHNWLLLLFIKGGERMTTTSTKKRTLPKGRPSKFTPEIKDNICEYISQGNYLDTSCRLAGIDYSTFRGWMVKGEQEGKGEYFEFLRQVRLAEAQAEAERVRLILQAGKLDDWKANAWYLERKYPDRWGKKEHLDAKVQSHHTETKEYKIEQQIETDPETVELVRQLWRRQQALGD